MAKAKSDKAQAPDPFNDEPAAGIGHNKGPVDPFEEAASGSADRLKSYVKRIEKLMEDKDAVGEDIKEVFSEVKGAGFNAGIVRKLVAIKRKDPEKYKAEMEELSLYASVFGIEV